MNFTVSGWGHVREYVLHRPHIVTAVTCPSRYLDELRSLASKHLLIKEDQHSKQVRAELQITPLYEKELAVAVGKGRIQTLVVLDHIVDPRNLGAIVRSAAFFGVQGIVIASRRQVPLTDVVVETARGGFALLDLYIVKNLARLLDNLKNKEFWLIGADISGEHLQYCDFSKRVFLFGSEGRGISPLLRKKCDRLLRIPSRGDAAPQSLNVSAAAAIFLYSQCLYGLDR